MQLSNTWDELIELGNVTEVIIHGEAVPTIAWKTVYANLLDDNRSEFYQASNVGLKPELTFEINGFEYENEKYIRYNEQQFTIIRAPKRGDKRELVVTSYTGVEP
jgi:hypothetical protein